MGEGEVEIAQRLGQRLRAAREDAGLSLRELAQRVGLRDHTVLIKYERGETPPSSARLVALARAIDCSAAALLADNDMAVAIITTIDRADEPLLAQLQFILEQLASAQPERPFETDPPRP
jgi:transcriptional regulator with XRE-family HTH domain